MRRGPQENRVPGTRLITVRPSPVAMAGRPNLQSAGVMARHGATAALETAMSSSSQSILNVDDGSLAPGQRPGSSVGA